MSQSFQPWPPNSSPGQGPFKWNRTIPGDQRTIILPAPRPGHSWDIFALTARLPGSVAGELRLETPERSTLQMFYIVPGLFQIPQVVIPSLTTALWALWTRADLTARFIEPVELEFSVIERSNIEAVLLEAATPGSDLEATNRLLAAQNAHLQRLQELAQSIGQQLVSPAAEPVPRAAPAGAVTLPFSVGVEIKPAPELSSAPRIDKRLKSFVKNMLEEES